MNFSELDWNSYQYEVYDRDCDRANGGPTDKEIYRPDVVWSGGGNFTDKDKEDVQVAFDHTTRTDNPHNVRIEQIEGLEDTLKGLKSDIEEAGIFDAANAVTSASGGARIEKNAEGKNEIVLDVDKDSAVEISNGKITLEWENN